MNRIYNILYDNFVKKSSNVTNINYNEISSIVNHSASHINCEYLNYIDLQESKLNIESLLNKLKPGGTLTVSILNAKKHAHNFINNRISGNDFLQKIIHFKSLLSTEDIYTLLDHNTCNILQLNTDHEYISITIERTKV